jgi:thiosulfate reductase cytochrome b subunit
VSLDDVKLIFAQAEKRLDDTVKTGESIATKTMTMITLMAGVLLALSGFIISDWKKLSLATHKDWVGVFGFMYILSLLIYMIRNVMPNRYKMLGSEPEELMIPQFFTPSIPQDKITLFIYMNEIEGYSERIRDNTEINMRHGKRFRFSVILFLALPMMLAFFYGLLEWLG